MGCSSPVLGHWACQRINHKVCDTWLVRRRSFSHLPSLRASPPFDRYQVILLGVRGTQVSVACLRPLHNGAKAGLEPATCKSHVRCPTDNTTMPQNVVACRNNMVWQQHSKIDLWRFVEVIQGHTCSMLYYFQRDQGSYLANMYRWWFAISPLCVAANCSSRDVFIVEFESSLLLLHQPCSWL